MNFSAVDFNPYQGTDKSPGTRINSVQGLQAFSSNSAIASSSRGDFDKVSIVPMPPLRQYGRSQPPQASQLDLLALLEKSLEPALRIEVVPVDVTVGYSEKFCLIHQESGLRVPGQFTSCEAKEILKMTALWDWQVDLKTREPACRHYLVSLLEGICKPPMTLEVAV